MKYLLITLLLAPMSANALWQCKADTLDHRIAFFKECAYESQSQGRNPAEYSEHCYQAAHAAYCEYRPDVVSTRSAWL